MLFHAFSSSHSQCELGEPFNGFVIRFAFSSFPPPLHSHRDKLLKRTNYCSLHDDDFYANWKSRSSKRLASINILICNLRNNEFKMLKWTWLRQQSRRNSLSWKCNNIWKHKRMGIINKNKCSSRAFCFPFSIVYSHLKAFNFNLIMSIPSAGVLRGWCRIHHACVDNFPRITQTSFRNFTLQISPERNITFSYIFFHEFNGGLCSLSLHVHT